MILIYLCCGFASVSAIYLAAGLYCLIPHHDEEEMW
jgi:hypothetical protein